MDGEVVRIWKMCYVDLEYLEQMFRYSVVEPYYKFTLGFWGAFIPVFIVIGLVDTSNRYEGFFLFI